MSQLDIPGVAPLRVVHLNSMLTGGGTDDQCLKLAAGLRRLNQEVVLAGPGERELSKLAGEPGLTFHATPPEGPLKLRLILAAARLLRGHRAQIVHGHHGRDLWPTILAAWLSGVRPKIVLTRHLAKSPSSWFSRRFLLGRCDALIAVSQFVARVLREGVYEPDSPEPERRSRPPLMGDCSKIHVIHGGIDTERFRPEDARAQREEWGLKPQDFVFGVVGGYDLPRGKGQREFLRAAAGIQERLARARFLIIGRGSMKSVLEADIQRLGLASRASLTPYARNMPLAMNALDCLVHPQVGTEAFPGVVLEAFACGKPVIASALDGIPEGFAVGQYGRLVSPENISELSEAMLAQAQEAPYTMEQRVALHEKVTGRFSTEALAANVLGLYRSLMIGSESGTSSRGAPARVE
jgi:glycosyltransferase involved in cell wall biosynthesis